MTSLIVACIYAKINLKNIHFSHILMEVLDVTYRIINWKYKEKISSHDIYNKTIMFSIDIYLIVLEEAI